MRLNKRQERAAMVAMMALRDFFLTLPPDVENDDIETCVSAFDALGNLAGPDVAKIVKR